MVEKRMQWTDDVLHAIWANAQDKKVQDKQHEISLILEYGAELHGDLPPTDAADHLLHAIEHMRHCGEIHEESGFLHDDLAASRCLLAFGSLIGLVK